MAKVKDSVWAIFGKSLELYFSNFFSLIKYMAFPVLGQIFGILLSLSFAFWYAAKLPEWIVKGGVFDNFSMIFIVLILAVIPGLIIFAKAFWDYLVAYGAINSMTDSMLKSGRIYDFPAHTEMVTRKTFKYIGLWILVSMLLLIGMFPLFWIIALILFVYFILIFQVFIYEPDKSIYGCFEKSVKMIKGNFGRTFGLMLLLVGFCYILLPQIFDYLLKLADVISYMAIPFDVWVQQLPIEQFNEIMLNSHITFINLTALGVAKSIVSMLVGTLIIEFTLPLRVICCSLWYKNLYKPEKVLDKKILNRAEGKA